MDKAVKSHSCVDHRAVMMGLHVPQRQEETGTQGKPARERKQCICAQEKQKSQEKQITEWLDPKAALMPPHLEYRTFSVS